MLNAFVIVWRESLEALLVVAVLLAWAAQQPAAAVLRRRLALGVGAGVLLSGALAVAAFAAQGLLDGIALDLFQAGAALAAALLIVQMLLWMRCHASSMRDALHARAGEASGLWGIAGVAALAVAREGSETAIFLLGVGGGEGAAAMLAGVGAGLATSAATMWLFARGASWFDRRTVFRVAEALLLLVAGAMLAHGIDRLIAIDWLPAGPTPVWDTSVWLPDTRGPGRWLADLAGYRARPCATQLEAAVLFWSGVPMALRSAAARRSTP